MTECILCHKEKGIISQALGVCLKCVRTRPAEALEIARQVHGNCRARFGLPEIAPDGPYGLPCNICVNCCRIPEKQRGICGLRFNSGKRLTGVSSGQGKLSWYHDPLPTNCVADWVCPGGTGAGFPEYAYRSGPETGYRNLAVFFQACSFNCLFCQNWHFRNDTLKPHTASVEDLVADIDERTACICFFGGDPTPQLPFALRAVKTARERNRQRILRICWETNGSMNETLLDRCVDTAFVSGGCIKFDLKAWDEPLHMALTGVTNKRTLANFKRAALRAGERPVPPLVIANTLLVPGYVDENEIRGISRFIASIDPRIPYSLLAFHPQFYMSDLPLTSLETAEACWAAAKEAGLENVRLGNIHLLV